MKFWSPDKSSTVMVASALSSSSSMIVILSGIVKFAVLFASGTCGRGQSVIEGDGRQKGGGYENRVGLMCRKIGKDRNRWRQRIKDERTNRGRRKGNDKKQKRKKKKRREKQIKKQR